MINQKSLSELKLKEETLKKQHVILAYLQDLELKIQCSNLGSPDQGAKNLALDHDNIN